MEPSISIRNLKLNFGALTVLQDLSLDVAEGEFIVLLGSSGCGKSTLLNCIAGLLDVTEGQIFIGGRNVTWEEPSRRGIGMVFQSYALYPQMTVEGNLSFGLKNAKFPRAEIKERVARAAKILQIEPLLQRKPAALSGGQRQRVALARCFVQPHSMWLLDEPFSALDPVLREEMLTLVKQLATDRGITVLMVTHHLSDARAIASHFAFVAGGQVEASGGIDELAVSHSSDVLAAFVRAAG